LVPSGCQLPTFGGTWISAVMGAAGSALEHCLVFRSGMIRSSRRWQLRTWWIVLAITVGSVFLGWACVLPFLCSCCGVHRHLVEVPFPCTTTVLFQVPVEQVDGRCCSFTITHLLFTCCCLFCSPLYCVMIVSCSLFAFPCSLVFHCLLFAWRCVVVLSFRVYRSFVRSFRKSCRVRDALAPANMTPHYRAVYLARRVLRFCSISTTITNIPPTC